ncbi:MAG TPA: hypothetical protein RMH85_24585 [Polyangiaceae bacterium LLY-WYZ-15_(1-7)]|nr:hypothetical protein [Polyangiaceae bacterium LLY-WYZ-15_(1-7)]HJL02386.1 hypothetical protein [Polyangiaceae bacterium LLY-WYZ-15_(1-7)]HJL11676.1 hypothetical protein [Polyangiaceae bacterium LLY-WYZ-15_(1-7)]HJL21013.1 hypothetical protein [Polyangiaceae bacterium LLY-WYZ-15_(1-7)]HJL33102.1 hypothetical protein [Polyangiaceae bacterium LLY-WYZ-15_(1-7)]
MSLVEAMRVLAGQAGDRTKAASLLRDVVVASAKRQRPDAPDSKREEAVAEAVYRLLNRLARGPLDAEHDGGVRKYVNLVVRSAFVDVERQGQRHAGGKEPDELPSEAPEDTHDEVLEQAAELGGRVLAAAAARFPRAKASLQETFPELVRLAEGTTTVEELLGGVGEAAFERQRNALYKRHERTRSRLVEALRSLEAGEELDAFEARAAAGYLLWLGAKVGGAK